MFKASAIASGSNGNCIFVQSSSHKFLFDCGISGKEASARLESLGIDASKIDALFISHEHTDHIRGAGIMARKFNIPLYMDETTYNECSHLLGNIPKLNFLSQKDPMQFGNTTIDFLKTSHDAVKPVGFLISDDKKNLGIITDTGIVNKKIKDTVSQLNSCFLEANYDPTMLMHGPYPAYLKKRIDGDLGHLSNEDASCLILDNADSSVLKNVFLSHLSQNNNSPELAYKTFKGITAHRKDLKDMNIIMTSRHKNTELIDV